MAKYMRNKKNEMSIFLQQKKEFIIEICLAIENDKMYTLKKG